MKFQNVITGKLFENENLKHRAIVFIVIVVIFLLNLYSKFLSINLYSDLTKVEKELASVTAKHAAINAERVHITRENNILLLVDKNKINLIKQSDPPIPIK